MQRKGRCRKLLHYIGKRPIYCGMPLDANGNCPEHGSQTS